MGQKFNLTDVAPRCPLCEKHFEIMFHPVKKFFCYVCPNCRIGIKADDPHVGQWEKILAKVGPIPCPFCDANMRYFSTSTGYMKARCPKKKCRGEMAAGEPDRQPGTDYYHTTPDKPGVVQQ